MFLVHITLNTLIDGTKGKIPVNLLEIFVFLLYNSQFGSKS